MTLCASGKTNTFGSFWPTLPKRVAPPPEIFIRRQIVRQGLKELPVRRRLAATRK